MLNHTANMHYSANGYVYEGFHFIAVFKAIDPKSESVQVAQNTYTFYEGTSRWSYSRFTEAIFIESKMQETIRKFHFNIQPNYVVCVYIFFGNIQMFDGPGIRSPKMQVTTNKKLCFMSFLGYMEIFNIVQDTNNKENKFRQIMTRKAREFMIYRSQPAHVTSDRCEKSSNGSALHLFAAPSNNDNVQCIWEVDGMDREVYINDIRFAGFNMLGPNLHTCQYGGFFIIKLGLVLQEPWFALCGNVAKDFAFSFSRRRSHNFRGSQYKLIFASFTGYSSGSLDAIYRFSKCDDLHFEDIGCQNTAFEKVYVKSGMLRPRRMSFTKVPICSEIWIYHNIGFKQGNTISNCEIKMNSGKIPSFGSQYFRGAFHTTIYNWVIFSTLTPVLQQALPYYNLNIDITAVNNFPLNIVNNHYHASVQYNDKKDISFQHFKSLQIQTNNSLNDLHIQIIKLQMYQFLVCSSFERIYFIDKTIHMLGIDDWFYRQHINIQSMEHIGSFCNIQLNGSTEGLKIDYWPRELDSRHGHPQHKIIVGILPATFCPSICTFDIKILESDLKTNKVYAHIWNNVSDIEWHILPKDRSFSLHIRNHLSTVFCIPCRILIKLKPLLPDANRFFTPTFGLSTGNVTGTWDEAAAICGHKSGHLATFNGQLKQNLLHEILAIGSKEQ